MIKRITPSNISGSIATPASKSYAQRAVAIATLAKGESTITNIDLGGDVEAVIKVASELGAKVVLDERAVTISSAADAEPSDSIFIGESGLATRLFTPLISLFDKPITVTGHGSILTRPITMMRAPLEKLGVSFSSNGEYLPVTVCGPMCGGEVEVDGSLSSQFLTGLLISLPYAQKESVLHVHNLQSKPYIDMTIEIMKEFGVEVCHDNYKTFHITNSKGYTARDYAVEGDWSGASALLVAGAVAGEITMTNLSPKSSQADIAIMDALESAGAIITYGDSEVTVSKGELRGYKFDATHCPDLFPALAALAANCRGVSEIKGISRLTHKESDRATVLKELYSKLGIAVTLDNDSDLMIIEGGVITGGVSVNSHNDHRIAMSAAVAALTATSVITIEGAESVNKSYAKFWDDLASVQC